MTSLSCFRPRVQYKQEPAGAPWCGRAQESCWVRNPATTKLCSLFDQRGAYDDHGRNYSVTMHPFAVRSQPSTPDRSFCAAVFFFHFVDLWGLFSVLQVSCPATRGTLPPMWPTHTWTLASQWLSSRACCSIFTRQRTLMCSGCWIAQKKKSAECGGYRAHKANYNWGPLQLEIS